MTTTTFVPHTLASDRHRQEMRAARSAGWRRVDLWWERLTERANASIAADKRAAPAILFILAWLTASTLFGRDDRRRITSIANTAWAFRRAGFEAAARRRYAAAARAWHDLPPPGDELVLAPRARSSLFHMRMEALHADTYRANLLKRLGNFVVETGETLISLSNGEPPGRSHFARWRGEKPAIFDDSRKILSACLLIAA